MMIGTLCAVITASTVTSGFAPTADLFAVNGPGSQFGFADQATCRISLCKDSFGNGPREVIGMSSDRCAITGSNFGLNAALRVRTIFPDQPVELLSVLSASPENSFTLFGGGADQVSFVVKSANARGASFTEVTNSAGMVLLAGADFGAVKRALQKLGGMPLLSVTGIVADADTVVISDAVSAYAFDVATGAELGRTVGSFAGATNDEIGLAGVLCALRNVNAGGVARLLIGVYAAFPNLKRMEDDCEP